jgi:hypothetical protein
LILWIHASLNSRQLLCDAIEVLRGYRLRKRRLTASITENTVEDKGNQTQCVFKHARKRILPSFRHPVVNQTARDATHSGRWSQGTMTSCDWNANMETDGVEIHSRSAFGRVYAGGYLMMAIIATIGWLSGLAWAAMALLYWMCG